MLTYITILSCFVLLINGFAYCPFNIAMKLYGGCMALIAFLCMVEVFRVILFSSSNENILTEKGGTTVDIDIDI